MCYIVIISHSLHWRCIKIALQEYVIMKARRYVINTLKPTQLLLQLPLCKDLLEGDTYVFSQLLIECFSSVSVYNFQKVPRPQLVIPLSHSTGL